MKVLLIQLISIEIAGELPRTCDIGQELQKSAVLDSIVFHDQTRTVANGSRKVHSGIERTNAG